MTLLQYEMQIPTLPERDPFILETVWATEPQFTRETELNYYVYWTVHHCDS